MSRKIPALLTFALLLSTSTQAICKSSDPQGVTVEARVLASPQVAYEALRSLRDQDGNGCRVISSSGTESVVEEIFDGLPVIGEATCVYRESYEPVNRLSFKMLRSDKLKAFEGEWTLQPLDDGEHTLVKLRTYIDTGLKVPFARQITEAASSSELKQQIADLKNLAERKQKSLAGQNKKTAL